MSAGRVTGEGAAPAVPDSPVERMRRGPRRPDPKLEVLAEHGIRAKERSVDETARDLGALLGRVGATVEAIGPVILQSDADLVVTISRRPR